MPKLLLPIAAVLAVGAATAGGATYVLTRGDSVEEVPPPAVQATGTPSPAATETPAAPTPTPTAKPEATATPTPDPTADWKTFQDAQHLKLKPVSFRYPPDWQREDNRVLSLGTAEWASVCIPPTEMLIDVSATPAEKVSRPEKATDLTLGTYSGWELFEDATEGCPGRAHTVAIERGGFVYSLILGTGLEADGEDVFREVVESLRISGD